jgi:hypothetical protein
MFLFRPAQWDCLLRLGQRHEALAGLLVALIDVIDWLIILPVLFVLLFSYLFMACAASLALVDYLRFPNEARTVSYGFVIVTLAVVLIQFMVSVGDLKLELELKKKTNKKAEAVAEKKQN